MTEDLTTDRAAATDALAQFLTGTPQDALDFLRRYPEPDALPFAAGTPERIAISALIVLTGMTMFVKGMTDVVVKISDDPEYSAALSAKADDVYASARADVAHRLEHLDDDQVVRVADLVVPRWRTR